VLTVAHSAATLYLYNVHIQTIQISTQNTNIRITAASQLNTNRIFSAAL